jgi:hypothetical protein
MRPERADDHHANLSEQQLAFGYAAKSFVCLILLYSFRLASGRSAYHMVDRTASCRPRLPGSGLRVEGLRVAFVGYPRGAATPQQAKQIKKLATSAPPQGAGVAAEMLPTLLKAWLLRGGG